MTRRFEWIWNYKGVRLLFVALYLGICSLVSCLGLPVTLLLIFVAMLSIVAMGGRLSSIKTLTTRASCGSSHLAASAMICACWRGV